MLMVAGPLLVLVALLAVAHRRAHRPAGAAEPGAAEPGVAEPGAGEPG